VNPVDITCQDLSILETDYLEGLLDRDDRLEIELHLTFCTDCVNHLDHLRRTIAALGAVLVDPLTDRRRDWLRSQLINHRPGER
jgi:anti-sigma factor RsiW